jgi:hypothetical protein
MHVRLLAGKLTTPHTDARSIHHAGRLIKPTIADMREGLSGWYITIDPPVCEKGPECLMRRLCWMFYGCVYVVGDRILAWPQSVPGL